MNDAIYSKMVRAGRVTYFIDGRESRNGAKYLSVTMTSPSKDSPNKFSKCTINVLSSAADEFVAALKDGARLEPEFARMVKSEKVTYFLDVKETKGKSKFLSITSSQPSKDDPNKFTRRNIVVFEKALGEFVSAIEEAISAAK